MNKRRITAENSQHQQQVFGIDEYEDHIVLAALLSRDTERVEIPREIGGKSVTGIGADCFFNCDKMRSVSIPDTVTSIGGQAFALCRGLTELIIPDSVTELGVRAFRDCRGLKRVVLSKNLKRLPHGAFAFCYLTDPEIILPEGLEVIEKNAFWSAGWFELRIPESVREIGVGAFFMGPRPITSLPEDKGWYAQWPYGEAVTFDGGEGSITDITCLEDGCEVYEVTSGRAVREFFFPCDYTDGIFSFADEKNIRSAEQTIEMNFGTRAKIGAAYTLRERRRWEKK